MYLVLKMWTCSAQSPLACFLSMVDFPWMLLQPVPRITHVPGHMAPPTAGLSSLLSNCQRSLFHFPHRPDYYLRLFYILIFFSFMSLNRKMFNKNKALPVPLDGISLMLITLPGTEKMMLLGVCVKSINYYRTIRQQMPHW